MSAVSLRLPDDVSSRLQHLAEATGRSKTFYMIEAIRDHLDDLEDLYLAERELEDIRAGRLTQILPAWTLPAGGIHAVYPAARFRPPKVTAFVAMLMEEHKRMAQTKMKRQ